jgi:hypothetical protein
VLSLIPVTGTVASSAAASAAASRSASFLFANSALALTALAGSPSRLLLLGERGVDSSCNCAGGIVIVSTWADEIPSSPSSLISFSL